MKSPNIESSVEIYYTKLEISTTDICKMFDCSRSTAIKLKNNVSKQMAKDGNKPFVPHHISTKTAFDCWGIEIADLELRLKKIKQLNLVMRGEEK